MNFRDSDFSPISLQKSQDNLSPNFSYTQRVDPACEPYWVSEILDDPEPKDAMNVDSIWNYSYDPTKAISVVTHNIRSITNKWDKVS